MVDKYNILSLSQGPPNITKPNIVYLGKARTVRENIEFKVLLIVHLDCLVNFVLIYHSFKSKLSTYLNFFSLPSTSHLISDPEEKSQKLA